VNETPSVLLPSVVIVPEGLQTPPRSVYMLTGLAEQLLDYEKQRCSLV